MSPMPTCPGALVEPLFCSPYWGLTSSEVWELPIYTLCWEKRLFINMVLTVVSEQFQWAGVGGPALAAILWCWHQLLGSWVIHHTTVWQESLGLWTVQLFVLALYEATSPDVLQGPPEWSCLMLQVSLAAVPPLPPPLDMLSSSSASVTQGSGVAICLQDHAVG